MNDKINTLIIDDERLARKELFNLLIPYKEINIIGECNNADSAIEKITKLNPHLIFLDIQMPGKNGFELLETLDDVPEVIFVTAYTVDDALELYSKGADYVILPHFLGGDRASQLLETFVGKNLKQIIKHKFQHMAELKQRKELGHEHPLRNNHHHRR